MTNQEIIESISRIKEAISRDQHGGLKQFVLRHLIGADIIQTMPESALNPYRPLPSDWTAVQIAVFDNGPPKPARKRKTIQRTKMRYAGNIKVWTREQINFSAKTQISWANNFHLWDHTIANQVAQELYQEKYIDQDTVDEMAQNVGLLGNRVLYSIPLLKQHGAGTRWFRSHIIMVGFGNGIPAKAVVSHPTGQIDALVFETTMANGGSFSGNVVAQARIARRETFASWATEIQPPSSA